MATGQQIYFVHEFSICISQEFLVLFYSMYTAISHQMNKFGTSYSVQQLRNMAASHMRSHKEDFMPFMDEINDETQFEKYCNDTECTSAWGSQLEVYIVSHF